MDTDKVTRVEVINHSSHSEQGRLLVFFPSDVKDNPPKVTLELQDDGRTLKVFIQ